MRKVKPQRLLKKNKTMGLDNVLGRFGIAVRALRKKHNLSQEELAERADLHRTYVSDIERGARNVSLESIDKLATALQTDLPSLFAMMVEATPTGGATQSTGNGSGARILMVEDDPGDAELALAAFKRAGVTNPIDIARDGAAAVDYLLAPTVAKGALPALILLDLQIPKISGLEVLRRIKSDERTRNIPVVVLTISQAARDFVDAKQLGATTYIVKPLDFQNFSRITAQLNFNWAMVAPPSP